MSQIVGLHLGNLAIIAADKRVMTMSDHTLLVDHDEAQKIIDTGLGYVTGSGIVELLDSVKEAITNTEITHTDQILSIFRKERDSFRSKYLVNPEWAEQQIEKTGWMFTYMTKTDMEAALRVALVHGAWNDDGIRLLNIGTAMVFTPVDGTVKDIKRLSDRLNQKLKTTAELPDLVDSISYHVPILRAIFKHGSETCESVSEDFHIAVHSTDGQRLMSEKITASTVSVQFKS